MSDREKKFSSALQCNHCGNTAPMEFAAEYSQTKDYSHEESNLSWEAGAVYELLVCPACSGVLLRRYYYHELRDPEEWVPVILYPQPNKVPAGLPEKIKTAYVGANKVKASNQMRTLYFSGVYLNWFAKIEGLMESRFLKG